MTLAAGQNAVGHIAGSNTTATTGSVTTAGSGSGFLIFTVGKGGAPSNIRDSKSNAYTQIGSTINYNFTGSWASVWRCLNGTGGAGHTASFDQAGFADGSVFLQEITTTGGGGISLDNAGVTANTDTTTPFVSNAITTVAAATAIFAFLAGNSTSATATHTVSGGTLAIVGDVNNGSAGSAIGATAGSIVSSVQTSLVASFTETSNSPEAVVFIASFSEATANLTLALTGVQAGAAVGSVTQSGGTAVQLPVGFIPRPQFGLQGLMNLASFMLPRFFLPTSALSPNVTLTLTGTTGTAVPGTLSPATTLTFTGNSAVGALGTITTSQGSSNLTLGLFGVAGTGFVGILTSSGGTLSSVGAVRTIFLSDVTPVPATAVYIAGTAFAQTGEMYVCPYPSDTAGIRNRGPFADRKDGARIVSSVGTAAIRMQGIGFTSLAEMLITLSPYDVVQNGVPLTLAGQVSVTAIS